MLNPDLLNIRFSTPSSFTAQRRSFDGGDTEQTCHEPWHPTKHSAGCHPYVVSVTSCCSSRSFALLSPLYTQRNRGYRRLTHLPKVMQVVRIEPGLESWSLMNDRASCILTCTRLLGHSIKRAMISI